MLGNMRIGTKIRIGFGILNAFIIALGIWGIVSSDSNAKKAAHVKEESMALALIAQDMKLSIVQVQQWLTDISATRGAAGYDDGYKNAEVHAKRFKGLLDQSGKIYRNRNDSQSLNELQKLEKDFNDYYAMGKKKAEVYIKSGHEEGNKIMKEFDRYSERTANDIDELRKRQIDELNKSMGSIVESSASMKKASIMISLISTAVGLLVGWVIVRMVVKPIRRVIEGLSDGAGQVASASSQVSSASQSLAEGASEQAAGIEETSASIEEMSSMTRQNADNANQANTLMADTSNVVDEANRSMIGLTQSMKEISAASEETAKIIKTIDEIAFQTNLLALNAAVEAARAGEAGAGFAVVADEVRNLAMRAADAAKNTANLIEGSVKKIKNGSDIVAKTNEAFTKVATGAKKVGELVGEISAASQEQAQGIDQINKAVAEMDRVVQQNAASAEESASASEEMNAQAEQMKNFVETLVTLVGNRNGHGETFVKSLSQVEKVRGQQKSMGSQRTAGENKVPTKKLGIPKNKEVRPDQVIPMDEKDFNEF